MPILFESQPNAAEALRGAISGHVEVVSTETGLQRALNADLGETLVVFGADCDATLAFDFAAAQRVQRPALGVVLIRNRVGASILSDALRSGVREVVKTDDLEALADACHRSAELSRQVAASTDAEMGGGSDALGAVVTVFSAKGGCGKTTVATNVSAALASTGRHRVCLVDLDLSFGDVAITLQLFPERTIADAVPMAGHVDEMGIRSIVTKHRSSGMDTLLAPLEPGDAERIPAGVVVDLMQQLKRMYDVIVVDTPPAFTDHVLAALDMTDAYLLVGTLDIPALKNLKLTLEMLEMLGYPLDKQQVILNRADAKVGLTIADAEAALHRSAACQVPSSRDVPASINRGEPIVLAQPSHQVSEALRDLALRLVPGAREAAVPPAKIRTSRRVSLLRRGEATA